MYCKKKIVKITLAKKNSYKIINVGIINSGREEKINVLGNGEDHYIRIQRLTLLAYLI